jgi:hypothetical protein
MCAQRAVGTLDRASPGKQTGNVVTEKHAVPPPAKANLEGLQVLGHERRPRPDAYQQVFDLGVNRGDIAERHARGDKGDELAVFASRVAVRESNGVGLASGDDVTA